MSGFERSVIPDSSAINYYMSRDLTYLRKTEKKYKLYAESLSCKCVHIRKQITELYQDLQDANAFYYNARRIEAVVNKDKKKFDSDKTSKRFPWCKLRTDDDVEYLAAEVGVEDSYKKLKTDHESLISELAQLEDALQFRYNTVDIDILYKLLIDDEPHTKKEVENRKNVAVQNEKRNKDHEQLSVQQVSIKIEAAMMAYKEVAWNISIEKSDLDDAVERVVNLKTLETFSKHVN